MKKCVLVSVVFLLCLALVPAYSQINVLEYFPLNIGDVFTYDDGAQAEITRTVELDWLVNVTAYEKVWTFNPNPQITDVRYYFIISGDSLFSASIHFTHDDVSDYAKLDPPVLLGTANTTPGDTLTTVGIRHGVTEATGMPEIDPSILQVVVNRSDPVSVPYGTFEDCITMTCIEVDVDDGEKDEFMNLILAKGIGIIQGDETAIASDLAPVHSMADFQQGVTPSGPKCDFNEDGNITIADVIVLLLYQRDNPGELKADFNQDGVSSISDAISMLLVMREGTCPDAGVLLAATSETVRIEGFTAEEIAYLEEIMAELDLTEEEEAAFRLFMYGEAAVGELPKVFSLAQNVPNPFNPATTIAYGVPAGASVQVTLKVYNLRGRLVRTLVDEVRVPGAYIVFWDGTDEVGRQVSSGVYFYRMIAVNFMQSRKMVLLK